MARYRGQKALYEVIGENRSRRRSDIEPVHPEPQMDASRPSPTEAAGIPVEDRWRRPRALQFNAGRVEITVSYWVLAVIILAMVFSLSGAYRIGLWVAGNANPDVSESEPGVPVAPDSSSLETKVSLDVGNFETKPSAEVSENEGSPPAGKPGNAIGILTNRDRTQLVPVQEYYQLNGIPTEILRFKSGFILVTLERFQDNPAREGANGYDLFQRIIELGAGYKPPSGYLTFTRDSFEGAHGVLIEN